MKIAEGLIVLPTPVGVIALTLEELEASKERVSSAGIVGTPKSYEPTVSQLKLLSADAIARQFDMEATWFLTRARENRLPHVRLGKYVRFDPNEIREFFSRGSDRHANS